MQPDGSPSDLRTGAEALIDVLRGEEVGYIFGNPGTTELPLMAALASAPDIQYVLGLQEAVVVGMADGYAQATRRPAFVNLHTVGGLGNAMGALTNAMAARVPLVITAGQQDYRHIVADPFLAGNLVGLATPVVKWAQEVRTLAELGTVLRRAFHDASSVPAGPVFVSLPMNMLSELGLAPVPSPSRLERRAVGSGLDELADLLSAAAPDRVAIVIDSTITASGAAAALVDLAEALGVRVHGAAFVSSSGFPSDHPLWAGALPGSAPALAAILANCDRVFVIGGNVFMAVLYAPGSPLPPGAELLHLSPDPLQLGRTYATRLGIVGDPRATLEALLPLVRTRRDAAQARASVERARAVRTQADRAADLAALARYHEQPMPPIVAAHALMRALPPETLLVDEAPATLDHIRRLYRAQVPDRYFFSLGGGLGWAMPAAIGLSLGRGRAPVLCLVGDGAAMYAPQALWTAAHERVPIVYVVVNNRSYNILKNSLRMLADSNAPLDHVPGMDLSVPPIDYLALARSMGVAAARVETADAVGTALRTAFDSGAPYLIDLPIAPA